MCLASCGTAVFLQLFSCWPWVGNHQRTQLALVSISSLLELWDTKARACGSSGMLSRSQVFQLALVTALGRPVRKGLAHDHSLAGLNCPEGSVSPGSECCSPSPWLPQARKRCAGL